MLGILVAGLLVAACESVGSSALEVGDCFADAPAFVGERAEVRPISCDQPHGGEVFFVDDYPADATFPGEEAFQAFVGDRCIPAYEAYTGRDLLTEDEMDLDWLQPSADGWAEGDHRIVCFATPIESGAKTSGSIRRP
jgi:hypothetical protein